MSSLTDRLRAFDPGSRRFAPRDAAASSAFNLNETSAPKTADESRELDAETRDVVAKFEAAFAQLVPTAPAPSPEDTAARAAILDVDLMDYELRIAFGHDGASYESSGRGAVHRPLDAVPPATARAVPCDDKEQNLSFEDAMATLRASEARGKAAINVDTSERNEPVRFAREEPWEAPQPDQSALQVSPDVSPAEPFAAANESWATRSSRAWPKVAGAAALALIVGTTVGYLAGKSPAAGTAGASIAATPEGGARLRFDYDLNAR